MCGKSVLIFHDLKRMKSCERVMLADIWQEFLSGKANHLFYISNSVVIGFKTKRKENNQ